jgi:GH43 family beta-xylosidase
MKNCKQYLLVLLTLFLVNQTFAQNPIIRDQFSADPSARVFGDTVYLYPSHDITAKVGQGRVGWFCMQDYHVFSSSNLTEWKDYGIIVRQDKVEWVKPESYSMWAPDCVFKNGKYYFYFPAPARDTSYGRGFSIGVAISENPYGPFIPEPRPIKGVHGIDPCPFIDKDGQAYVYWAARNIVVAKLKDNMTELASEPQIIANMPDKGMKEGPFLFERNGIYYLTYPHVQNKTECLEYAMGISPTGPFKVAGVIMDEAPNGCWTNHQSFINFKNQWYLFYHNNDLSPNFDKNRSVRVDSMFFNADGTIRKVIPTLRGVGLTEASQKIQIDRYSRISDKGVSVAFLDTSKRFDGWKTVFDSGDSWIQYNSVDFGKKSFKSVNVRASSKTGGTLQLRLNSADGPMLAKVNIPKGEEWNTIKTSLSKNYPGIHHIVIQQIGNNDVEIDWISFE